MTHIIPHNFSIKKQERNKLNKHNSFVVWFTGLSGSGKSTLANALEIELYKRSVSTYVLDGDSIRKGLNEDLSFSSECRSENIRRVGEVAGLMVDAGIVVLASFVSPYKNDRKKVESIVGSSNFVEVFVNTDIEECKKRDVKGLYKMVKDGEILNMTGITSPYEAPENPEIEIKTELESIEASVQKILKFISSKLKLKHE